MSSRQLHTAEYALRHAFWGALLYLLYGSILFSCLPGMTAGRSRLILIGMMSVCAVVGVGFTPAKQRTEVRAMVDELLPLELYSAWAWFSANRVMVTLLLAAAGILSALLWFSVLREPVPQGADPSRTRSRRISRCVHSTQLICACCLLALMGFVGGRTVLARAVMSVSDAREYAQVKAMTETQRMDAISMLDEDTWQSLSASQRLSVLQTVADLESSKLGLPQRLLVRVAELEDPVAGSYVDADRTITVSAQALIRLSAMENLRIICHEAYHAYQYRLVEVYENLDSGEKDLLVFRNAAQYAREFADYASAEGDPESYYLQLCERESRSYAEEAVRQYYDEIAVYLAAAKEE